MFDLFDLDGSGSIESSELLQLGKTRRNLGQKSREWTKTTNQEFYTRMDTNRVKACTCTPAAELTLCRMA